MLLNGKPCTNENGWEDYKLMEVKSDDVQQIVSEWIKGNLIQTKTFNSRHSSYSLKHLLEKDTGIYLANNEFKDAMRICGYVPQDENELNWIYCISQKSPAIKKHYK